MFLKIAWILQCGPGGRERTLAVKSLKNPKNYLKKIFFLHISSSYAKILGEQLFHTWEIPRSGSKVEDGEKERERESDRDRDRDRDPATVEKPTQRIKIVVVFASHPFVGPRILHHMFFSIGESHLCPSSFLVLDAHLVVTWPIINHFLFFEMLISLYFFSLSLCGCPLFWFICFLTAGVFSK